MSDAKLTTKTSFTYKLLTTLFAVASKIYIIKSLNRMDICQQTSSEQFIERLIVF